MDPNEALKRLREIMPRLREWAEREEWPVDPTSLTNHDADLLEVVETFEGLDNWVSRDGFLPDDWKADEDKPWHARSDS
jgi:hypothetical protein